LATAESFGGGLAGEPEDAATWLKTGDLGYLADGELFICGRAKDLIILNGKNYYPQDIERIVSRVDGVRDGQCVAFSRLDESGAERAIAVIVAEAERTGTSLEALSAAIVQARPRRAGRDDLRGAPDQARHVAQDLERQGAQARDRAAPETGELELLGTGRARDAVPAQ
jgi:fatty-acyl-CoA synthase